MEQPDPTERSALLEQSLMDIRKHAVLEKAVEGRRLQQVEAVSVDGTDVHLAQPLIAAQFLRTEPVDPILEFSPGLLGKSEGHDAGRSDAFRGPSLEKMSDPRRHYLGLAGASAGDDLEIAAVGFDGSLLMWCVWHGFPR